MIYINKKYKVLLNWGFAIIIIAAIIYTFRDMIGPIWQELKKTSPWVLVAISAASIIYELVEGWINYSFARKYNPEFTYWMGVESAFFISFYRTASLGSGAGVAAIYYFNEKGIIPSKGTGMYLVEYVLHKVSIAIFSAIFFVCSWTFMTGHYADYLWLLAIGYGITFVVAVVMVLACCSKKIHAWLFWLLHKLNRNGRFDDKIEMLHSQCDILEEATAELLGKKKFALIIILKDMLKFFFWYMIPYLVLASTGMVTPMQVLAITSVAVMLAAVIPAPAGIGSSEFVITMMYAALVGTGLAGSVSLLYRFATFVLPFVVGALVVIFRRRLDRRIHRYKEKKV